jgi:hypothetical protein
MEDVQRLPIGRSHTRPPLKTGPQTRALALEELANVFSMPSDPAVTFIYDERSLRAWVKNGARTLTKP